MLGQKAGLLAELARSLELVWRLMRDPRVATAAKFAVPALTALYILSPVDLIPDVIPVLGQMDDLAILAVAVRLFIRLAPPHVVREHEEAIARRSGRATQTEGETVDGEYRIIE